MSDILIKNMKMPENCVGCPLAKSYGICAITKKTFNWGNPDRLSDCPLIEILPHGRLIDADKLRAEFPHPNDWRNPELAYAHLSGIWATIDCAETIIEAEGCEDG